ncbi:unnamed protein product [Adineta ricciae]|uniref:CCHC-type domain-containing protein n=1 Tax=Adineta ricciae TaxID=249248 RepID=A0A815BI70_ADIRI|nr:unnamed protein product [Adineta ricciae]
MVVGGLIKYSTKKRNFELKTIAYRKWRAENNEHCILIFVENAESFSFLYEQSNWPTTLANCQYTIRKPSIPPQLALVLSSVSLQTDWGDFVQELKDKHSDIINVIRLRNKAQQPVRAVKLEFSSLRARNDLLATGEVLNLHMKYKVVECFTQENVLICSNCYGIGHFRKNCSQKNESTCKTCGEKCANLKDHQCSGILKCIHCGGAHVSSDNQCKVVRNYRAALTKNLLANSLPNVDRTSSQHPTTGNKPIYRATNGGPSYVSLVRET